MPIPRCGSGSSRSGGTETGERSYGRTMSPTCPEERVLTVTAPQTCGLLSLGLLYLTRITARPLRPSIQANG
jgi:hypothetical protein